MKQVPPGVQRLLLGRLAPGSWSITSLSPDIGALARRQGWEVHEFGFDGATDKRAVLDALAVSFAFPSYFGHNLDAAYDCFTDCSWTPGARVLLSIRVETSSALAGRDLVGLSTLLTDVAEFWATRDVKIFALFIGCSIEPTLDYWDGLDEPEHPPMA